MMQPSNLDKKIQPLSPSLAKKQNRVSEPTVSNHLSAVSKCTPSQINGQEMSPKDVSNNDQNWTAQIPKTDIPSQSETQCEDKLTTPEVDMLYIAECPEVGTVDQGETIEQAIASLREATQLYLEEFPLPILCL